MTIVLVTGANGFIGRPLCNKLARQGCDVKGVVRSASKNQGFHERIIPVVGDIVASNPDDWRKWLNGVNIVIHLAACVHQSKAPRDMFRKVNTHATSRLYRLAEEAGVKRFVFLSTVKVNGETSTHPFSEKDNADPQGPYAISKWRAEQRLKAITQGKECQYTIIRPPLVYGPRVKANFLSLLKLISADMPLPLGSLHNRRSMVYVGNLVDAIICAMDNPHAAGQVFMVSDGQDLAVGDLVKTIAKSMDQKPKVFPFPPSWLSCFFKIVGRGAMVDKLCQPLTADISKIRGTLGWRPPFSVNQGLAATVDWYRKSHLSGKGANS